MKKVVITPEGQVEVDLTQDELDQCAADAAAHAASLVKTWDDVRELQTKMFNTTKALWRVARYSREDELTGKTPTDNYTKYQELLQYCDDIGVADEATCATPQLALDALNALTEPE